MFAKEICTFEDIERMEKDGKDVEDLLFNMKINHYKKVVKTRRGNWQPWEEDVEYISE